MVVQKCNATDDKLVQPLIDASNVSSALVENNIFIIPGVNSGSIRVTKDGALVVENLTLAPLSAGEHLSTLMEAKPRRWRLLARFRHWRMRRLAVAALSV